MKALPGSARSVSPIRANSSALKLPEPKWSGARGSTSRGMGLDSSGSDPASPDSADGLIDSLLEVPVRREGPRPRAEGPA
eukprot:13018820-Alexandrium_andersonii.AAC.1